MKGIVLAGGTGTRLYPITKSVCKQLLPIYDKPLIYYPLSVLMLAKIRDILIICTNRDLPLFQELFGDGSPLGLRFSYAVQKAPNGIAEAFLIGKDFIGTDNCCLVLGDNIFYGQSFSRQLQNAAQRESGATIFACRVSHPQQYGVVTFDNKGNVLSIKEKPDRPSSDYAVTGLYFYDNEVIRIAEQLKPSSRGELEITDINQEYLQRGQLKLEQFGRGFTWLDTGRVDSLMEAADFVHTIERRQGLKVACLEEIAYLQGYINCQQLLHLAEPLMASGYGQYLVNLAQSQEN